MSSILTFYSFKGGVGRSMALANIGYLLAVQMNKRVICIDWDLEAPGLEKYFSGCPGATIQNADKGGLIDLLGSACRGESADWREFVSTVAIGDRKIDLITSGKRDASYAGKVLGFDWHVFFENADGGEFIEKLRDEWHREYDFALIDSRTGFTDAGGVCTVQLPDILVPVFTTTDESARGAIDVVERAQVARQKLAYDRSRLLIFPLPSRYDGRTQYNEAKDWLHRFAEWFGPYYSDWLPPGITPLQVIERTKLPYIGYFSFGTQMPAAVEGTTDPESLGFAYNVAATIIAHEFQQVERLIAAVPDSPDQPSREELALFRMRRALQESKFEWKSIDSLATGAGVGVTEALDVLRGEPEVDFARGKSGRVIARFRNGSQSSSFSRQRSDARDFFDALSIARPCNGYQESSFFPNEFQLSRFGIDALSSAATRSSKNIVGRPFLRVLRSMIVPFDGGLQSLLEGEEFGTDDPVDFWRIHKSGLLYQRSALRPNPFVVNERKQCAVDLGGTAFQVARAIDCLVHFYDELLGKNDHVVFAFSLLGVEGWPLIQLEGPRPISLIGISDKSEITVSRSSSLKDWREGLVEQALDISAEVFLNFGCTSADLEMARAMILRYSDQSVA